MHFYKGGFVFFISRSLKYVLAYIGADEEEKESGDKVDSLTRSEFVKGKMK